MHACMMYIYAKSAEHECFMLCRFCSVADHAMKSIPNYSANGLALLECVQQLCPTSSQQKRNEGGGGGAPAAVIAVGAVPWKPCALVSLPPVTCTEERRLQ